MDADSEAEPTPFIEDLQQECHHLINAFSTTETGKKLIRLAATCAGKQSHWARCKWAFSTNLHTIEDMCLRSMQRTGNAVKWPINTLMFDGGHVPKLPGKTEADLEQLLRLMEQKCKAETGFEIELAHKEFEVPPGRSRVQLQTHKRAAEEHEGFAFEDQMEQDDQSLGPTAKRRRLDQLPHDKDGESWMGGDPTTTE